LHDELIIELQRRSHADKHTTKADVCDSYL